jgi:methionyl-tRNA synthetase
VRYRTGKALVPFRITGNISWGVPAPELEGTDGLTIWCWPESLWAPISFTQTWLENDGEGIESLNPARARALSEAETGSETGPEAEGGASAEAEVETGAEAATSATETGFVPDAWKSYWCSPDATVYQFIGQDNIYFYGVAQTALWAALPTGHEPRLEAAQGELQQSRLVANYHLLFLDKKASSSGEIKPPMADDLLAYYTAEQLRAHFLALGLGLKPVSFQPKPLDPRADERAADPALKEGALLTNVFNRLARSCFYAAQKDNNGLLPLGVPSAALVEAAHTTILEYERRMHAQEFHAIMQLVGEYIRGANKYWSDAIKEAGDDPAARLETLRNAFYLLRVCTVLMHPIVPSGTRMIFEYLNLKTDERTFFSWEHIFAPGYEPFLTAKDTEKNGHPLRELPPRTDFFARHESQA